MVASLGSVLGSLLTVALLALGTILFLPQHIFPQLRRCMPLHRGARRRAPCPRRGNEPAIIAVLRREQILVPTGYTIL
jgi:hypothetical protein